MFSGTFRAILLFSITFMNPHGLLPLTVARS
jgi:hypothetical protein